ncbi:hypothetical protein BDN70DRAFT_990634 [Pholiota conissans]|uniref:F-box domain-containing protein n=1 Tax=Pholiota conissans TaxID=109636 RepID=A0A9P5ZC07_9AGAR|nr:hypothetical protein BDN70DRAFT_990634 [Pholiota conissans]
MSVPCQFCHYPRSSSDGSICKSNEILSCTPCQKVADLEEQILTMRKKIVELEEQRRQWKTQVNATHDGLTRKLPIEVTAEIFDLCLVPDICSSDLSYSFGKQWCKSPLELSAVSQRWRQIAHATPRLWSDIPLRIRDTKTSSLPELTTQWIERSGQRPLSINIHSYANSRCAQDVIKILNGYASRWKHLTFSGHWHVLPAFATNLEGVSNIQTLYLRARAGKGRSRPRKFDLGKYIVRPKRLVAEPLVLDAIVIDWSHLTELEVSTSDSIESFIIVLRSVPQLKKCKFSSEFNQPFIPGIAPANPFAHHSIVDLTVTRGRSFAIFVHLLCPALEKLTIGDCEELGAIHQIIYFMNKSQCSIIDLSVCRIKLQQTDVDLLCQAIPTLHRLCIDSQNLYRQNFEGFDDHLFSLLARESDARPRFLPELCSLVIITNDHPPWSSDFWTAFLSIFNTDNPQSSQQHRRKLETVTLCFDDDTQSLDSLAATCDERIRAKLLSLKGKGVQVKIQLWRRMSVRCRFCHYPRTSSDGPIRTSQDTSSCLPCRKVAELDEQIQTLRKKTIELEEQRREWKTQVNDIHDGLTNKLPIEVAAEIFNLCLPVDICSWDLSYSHGIRIRRCSPLVLSAVSQRWRKTAHATPRLWADVPLHINETTMPSLPELTTEWIERSGQQPLSINIYTPTNSKFAQDIINIICAYASRWKHFAFSGHWHALSTFSTSLEGISHIQTLSFKSRTGEGRSEPGKFDLKKFVVRPKRLIAKPFFPATVVIDWSHLTELEVSMPASIDDFIIVLRTTPRLKICKVSSDFRDAFDPGVGPVNPFVHPCIVDLTVLSDRSFSIFARFLCPALERLTIGECDDLRGINHTSIYSAMLYLHYTD